MYRDFFIALISLSLMSFPACADVLKEIKDRGFLKCGINVGVVGFSELKSNGKWEGFDVDFCRTLASTIFNDPDRIQFSPMNAKERFIALTSGEIDVLSRNTSWNLRRETEQGIAFRPITYYDGQGIMVNKRSQVSSISQLDGATVCVQAGTTTESTLADYFRSHAMSFEPVVLDNIEEVDRAYYNGRCDAYTGDKSALYPVRLNAPNPSEHVILNETISKEPLGPSVRRDFTWFNVVSWAHYAQVYAEELGITQKNVDQMLGSKNPEIRRFLGIDKSSKIGETLGLKNDWAYKIIKHVGNYGEVFDRNLGSKSLLKIPRGHNALWSKGGLMYSPPIR
ncbi:MAG: amino acid ABC transporter substrate-binding protein [Candidatus Liberibacter ctenarytainae]|uniref:Amino acid ABC transporter substrate-binding protein n=1 Tax=Candidatus Liberibacter ctenarytainae TaxID=2020335 RepID=A0A937AFB8_9HYPH|nr:amino acid ABC transporter substrate-binding protein [Candidatus Liberibacter ctenarytainae]